MEGRGIHGGAMTPQHVRRVVAASAVIALTALLSGVVAQSAAHRGRVDDEEQVGQEVFNELKAVAAGPRPGEPSPA
jgi:hypothetical protein